MATILRYWSRTIVGMLRSIYLPGRYEIKSGYFHRSQVEDFDDTSNRDEYQKEVYQRAAKLMEEEVMDSVCDLGCGSGYKLLAYLGKYRTIGVEISQTYSFLKSKHPERTWFDAGKEEWTRQDFDLLICADVIEHIRDPDVFLEKIAKLHRVYYFIFSTPERDLKRGRWSYGPPLNPYHYREWNKREFVRLLSRYFRVIEHTISNHDQGTQMVICKKR